MRKFSSTTGPQIGTHSPFNGHQTRGMASRVGLTDGDETTVSVTDYLYNVHDRLPRPLLAADKPPAPLELRHALTTIDRHIHAYTAHARLGRQPENPRHNP